ncbi:MAG: protein kinase [Muribaculaceae bacterium]|nr:protein kinase [Muribaculaceae bacterium]
MAADDDKISGFESQSIIDDGPIDFGAAQRLEREGSTCDVFVTRLHRRRVFVKRLKKEFRANTVYSAAFDKEFDLGVELQHKSLPRYREFHDDYIVMDFIDGVTLSEAMKSEINAETPASAARRWLSHPGNLRRMLKELIDVTGYLHRHNVVHCDIKPDNIILTDGTFNLMLIDFDKSYTSWLDDTSGSPALYGVAADKRGNTDIDFHGIGKIIETLIANDLKFSGLAKLRNRCFVDGVTADDLMEIIGRNRSQKTLLAIPALLTFLAIGGGLWFYFNKSNEHKETDGLEEKQLIVAADTSATDEKPVAIQEYTSATEIKHQQINTKVDVESMTAGMFILLYSELNSLESTIADTTLTADDIYRSLQLYHDTEKDCFGDLYTAVAKANNTTNQAVGAKLVWESDAWRKYMHYSDSIKRMVSNEWRARGNRG